MNLTANESVLLLDEKASPARPLADVPGRRLSSPGEVAEALASGRGPTYWIAREVSTLLRTLAAGHGPHGDHNIVVLEAVNAARQAVLDAVFRRVLVLSKDTHVLPFEELAEVFASPNRDELFIGGIVDRKDGVVVLYRGNMEPVLVPATWFVPSGNGVGPDFADLEVTDFGQTIRLGSYEAAGDAILYEFDPEYRRQARNRLGATDQSFGACLRRLRLQKGVRRDDFPGVSEKQIARIERGETGKPRAITLKRVASRLGVRPEEIEGY